MNAPPLTPIKLIECPRDAMQGWKHFIPTATKINYLNALLKVGFDTLDCGSFVSPKAIPQMADTAIVLEGLELSTTQTKLLAIIANERGAADAVAFDQIQYLGFPFSVSPTFQLRNTNSTIEQSLSRVEAIQQLCVKHHKQMVVYISMGFGNPYGDAYHADIVQHWIEKLVQLDIKILSMADTVGLATATQVSEMMKAVIPAYSQIEIGVHLHSTAFNWKEKVDAALTAGCTRFDGALKGIGGCPMADDVLVGNMDTELMMPYFQSLNRLPLFNESALQQCTQMASSIFI